MSTDIEAIRARLAAATPGPWRFLYDASHTIVADSPGEEGRSVGAFTGGPAYVVGGTYNYPEPQNAANAEFIAHAPEDIAALLDEIERLLKQRDGVLALHQPATCVWAHMPAETICEECEGDWPCPTARALGVTE